MQAQRGQAIVLIAIMLAVVVGMAALAVDGSRAYATRRDLQAAVDAAALAAGDKLQQAGTYSWRNRRPQHLWDEPSPLLRSLLCLRKPGAGPVTVTCNYADGTVLTQVVSALGPQGSQFTIFATLPPACVRANPHQAGCPGHRVRLGRGEQPLLRTDRRGAEPERMRRNLRRGHLGQRPGR